jgi:predicted enzyme related to lactoylglutathione lyase
MGIRHSYQPGTPSYVELSSSDPEGAERFYLALFGWDVEHQPIGEDTIYRIVRQDGQRVAAISPQQPQQRDAGVPSIWQTYITVEDADASLGRAGELGGTVHAGPFDVFDAGRMGVVQDPQGAFFAIWQPNRSIGSELVNAPGAFSWSELVAPDADAAGRFYGELFGWTVSPFEASSSPYWLIQNRDRHGIGGMRPPQPHEPASWLVYFGCEAIEATSARVAELGGQVLHDPISVSEDAQVVTVMDPQGAVFALYAGRYED